MRILKNFVTQLIMKKKKEVLESRQIASFGIGSLTIFWLAKVKSLSPCEQSLLIRFGDT